MDNNRINHQQEGSDLDRLFRDQLVDHRIAPSGRLWKNLNRKLLLREISRLNFSNLSRNTWMWGSAGILVLTGLLVWVCRPDDPSAVHSPASDFQSNVTSTIHVPATKAATASRTAIATQPVSALKTVPEPAPSLKTRSSSITAKHQAVSPVPDDAQTKMPEHALLANADPYPYYEIMQPGMAPVVNRPASINIIPLIIYDQLPVYREDTMTFMTPGGTVIKMNKERPEKSNFFSAGIGIAPEYLNYRRGDERSSEFDYWLNGSFTWHIGRFSLQTGLGLGYFTDEGIYHVEYKSNDSVGFFYDVSAYTVDPLDPGQITYSTIQKTIWDSIKHIADDRTRNRYTYLQVPLLFGIDLYQGRTFTLTLNAGPAASFLIGKKEAAPALDYPNARIIRVDNNTPERTSVNWQLWLKINMEFRLNRNLSLFAEPYYKYYFRPLVSRENLEVQRPLSLGLNVGIFYHFGLKKEKP